VARLASPLVSSLRGVGPRLSERLGAIGIYRVEDLLFRLPLRYQDRTRITAIGALQDGDDCVVEGTVRGVDVALGRRRSLICKLQDGTGTLTLRFFHFSRAQQQALKASEKLRCYGQVRRGGTGPEMFHPDYQRLDSAEPAPVADTLTPIYPGTEGISQAQWRRLCSQALDWLDSAALEDLLPDAPQLQFTLEAALRYLHAPPPDARQALLQAGQHPAQLRLALEELVAHQLSMRQLREQLRRRGAPVMPVQTTARTALLERLPFTLTAAQARTIDEISSDLARNVAMLRLLQGDVGAGKTLVAACAAVQALGNKFQVAVMAPTELLSEQHLRSFSTWLQPLGYQVGTLTGRIKGKPRAQALAAIGDGTMQLVVGTHALFQSEVVFARLGLVIVDEQHRFGVHQRLALAEKGALGIGSPHQLIMTATPIPRTLAMVAYADLDSSIIDELPPGRQPVQTLLVDAARRETVMERVAAACAEGRQAYWVCTLIEESDQLQAQAAARTAEELQHRLPQLSIGLLHGRMKPTEKEAVMAAFKVGSIALLVATTVIEVGVDVPNASLMVIENPERLGLAQLHQLRGRVGRGTAQSHCVLLYQTPLSHSGRIRLTTLRESNDGFFIAERDLALRGPGEVLGTRQTGTLEFRVASLPAHEALLDTVQQLAEFIWTRQRRQVQPLLQRWLGDAERFARV